MSLWSAWHAATSRDMSQRHTGCRNPRCRLAHYITLHYITLLHITLHYITSQPRLCRVPDNAQDQSVHCFCTIRTCDHLHFPMLLGHYCQPSYKQLQQPGILFTSLHPWLLSPEVLVWGECGHQWRWRPWILTRCQCLSVTVTLLLHLGVSHLSHGKWMCREWRTCRCHGGGDAGVCYTDPV